MLYENSKIMGVTDVYPSELEHVDYPHTPGYLYDCAACEFGPCECKDHLGNAECVSVNCEMLIIEEC